MLIIKSRKQQMTEGIELTNQTKKNQNAQRKGNLQVLGNTESGQHQTSRGKTKEKKYIRRTRK